MAETGAKTLSVIILGCGRVGSTLARQMARAGHKVTVLDLTRDAFRRLGTQFGGTKHVGNGLDQNVLRDMGLERADVFVAVTQGDNTNIMAAQVAREVFGVARVIARIYDPIRAQAYRDMGIDTICTTTVAAGLIRGLLSGTDTALLHTTEAWNQEYLDQMAG